uniref:NADH-ubiquinone oxidoreductase chain 2 n=1 Tax=Novacerus sp. FZ-2019 TaxID=2585224 RepID=A0A6H0EWS7_9HEXA|nr:NADH dehydrogenase subunit 2 [Novacerus sp. FZ-2019]
MKIKIYHLMFLSTLMLGTMVAISSNSWFTCWIGLEINLMSMIPLFVIKLKPSSSETAIKYFLIQAMASLILMFSSIMMNLMENMNILLSMNYILILTIAIKVGVPPFHFWFIQIIEMTEWMQCSILMTWQKVAPLFLMFYSSNYLSSVILVMASSIGSLGGYNQNSIKKILAYSSIMNLAWMLASMMISFYTFMTYFLFYSMIIIMIITSLFLMNTKTLEMYANKIEMNKTILFLNFMSLGGLPPFIGFFIKMNIIKNLSLMSISITMIIMLIFASLITLWFYLKLLYSSILTMNLSYYNLKINIKNLLLASGLVNLLPSVMIIIY